MLEQVDGSQGRVALRRAGIRASILEEAWELCRAEGLTALSLRDLAARVGMRAPSLYSYFSSKDEIYDAMFAKGQRALIERYVQLPEDGIDRELFRRGAREFMRFCIEDPVRYQLMFQRVVPGFVPSEESYALAVQVVEKFAGQLDSVGVSDPRHVDLWTAIMTGLTDQQISNDPGGTRWERLVDEAVDMFCDHVGIN